MSLDSIKYITETNYKNDQYSDDLTRNEDKDIDNFFKLKIDYFSELNKINQDKAKKITSIIYNDGEGNESVTTNYPIKFKEENGKYIIHVINDEAPNNILYTKTISINKRINVVERLRDIENAIKNNNFIIEKFNLFNRLEALRRNKLETEILNSENFISDSEKNNREVTFENESKSILKEYNELKIKNSSLSIESNILNDLLAEFIANKIQKHSSYFIDANCEQYKSNRMFIDIVDKVSKDGDKGEIIRNMIEYVKLHQIINQSGNNLPGDLVYYTGEDGIKNVGFLRSDISSGATEKVMIQSGQRDIFEIDYSNIEAIKGLHELMTNLSLDANNFSLSYEKYREEIAQVYPEQQDLLPEYQRQVSIIDNSEGNLIKAGKINYMYDFKGIQKTKVSNVLREKSKKKKKNADPREIRSTINIVDEDKLYNNEDIFMFYSASADSKPGRGTKEDISSGQEYTELKVTKDWRKKLSNFHIRKDKKDNITPIIIDGIPFASVEHYFHFCKFWNVPSYTNEKKQQYNEYALKFTFNYKGDDGWGKSDASKAKLMGGKTQGFPHRPDWLKPFKGITKETIEEQQLGGGNFITLRDYTLLKGIYAKFSQFKDLKKILINTGNAKLIHPIGGSPRKNEYEVAFQLLYTRYLIKNSLSLFKYDNFNTDMNRVNKGIIFLMAKFIKEERLDLDKHNLSDVVSMISKSFRYSIYWKKNIIKQFSQDYNEGKINIDDIVKNKGDITPSKSEEHERVDEELAQISQQTMMPTQDPEAGIIQTPMETQSSTSHSSISKDEQKLEEETQIEGKSRESKSSASLGDDITGLPQPKTINLDIKSTTDGSHESKSIASLDDDKSGLPQPKTINLDIKSTTDESLPMDDSSEIQSQKTVSDEQDIKIINLPKSDAKETHLGEQSDESIEEEISEEYDPQLSRPIVLDEAAESKTSGREGSLIVDSGEDEVKGIQKKSIDSQQVSDDLLEHSDASSQEVKSVEIKQESKDIESESIDRAPVTDETKISQESDISSTIPRSLSEEQRQLDQVVAESFKTNQELMREIENLNVYVESSGKTIFPVPPDGNCGYYSVVETMAIANIYPLNFKEDGELMQYSRERETHKVSFAQEEEKYSYVLSNAMLELRRDTAIKFESNFIVGETQSDSIEAIKTAIKNTYSSPEFTDDVKDKYIESIRNSALSKQKIGSWITDIELGLISAMFNINIKVYNSDNTTTHYNSSEYKELYPNKPNRNMGATPKTIELGYITNYHYVGVISMAVEQTSLENIIYHTITLEVEDQPYELAVDFNKINETEFQAIPLGLYDQESHKIRSLKMKKNPLHLKLINEFRRFIEKHNPNSETITNEGLYTQINYYKDISSGKVYRSATTESEELGRVKVRNLKDGKTYSQIIFN